MPTDSALPLAGDLVVDLSDDIAGAYCSKILADGGARLVRVESSKGDRLRGWSASGTAIPDGSAGPLFRFLTSRVDDRIPVDADSKAGRSEVDALLAQARVVVWSRDSGLAGGDHLVPSAIRARHPHLTVTAISPFGLEGPWADRAATDFTIQAWSGGIVGLGRGSAERPPVSIGGQVGEWLTGAWAAVGTIAARRAGGARLIDVSKLETAALCLTYCPVSFAETAGRPFRDGRARITPGVERTSDGLVGVGVGTGQQWLDFCTMVEHPEWMEDRSLFANRSHLAPEIAEWMGRRTTAEVLDLASALRIPHAPISNGATVATADQVVARGALIPNRDHGFLEPDLPYRFDPPLPTADADAGADQGGEDRRERTHGAAGLPYERVRVLDLTSFWAGPLCTHGLAMLGAEVIHLESTARPDGTRLLAGLRFTEPDWWEKSGIFSGLNTNKKSVTLDLGSVDGRALLRRLIDTCDVVVENFTPRVVEQLGLDLDALRADRPDLVVVRMPGFGLDGPWRDDPAFAFVIEDAAGLTWLTGHPDEPPVSPYCVGDSNAGTHALLGLMLALERRDATGRGCLVEASMLDAALNIAAEQIVEHSANGVVLERQGNRGPVAAPQNLYLAADTGDDDSTRDTWVAIAVADDAQWVNLVDALGRPAWARTPSFVTAAGRRAAHDELDQHLSAWCAERTADDIVDALWSAGVPTARVLQPHEQADLPQMQARAFFEPVSHPVVGTVRHSTLPFRVNDPTVPVHRHPAPLLGEHTRDELIGLGLSDSEVDRLTESGVVGRMPDVARVALEKAAARRAAEIASKEAE